jgi:hypothetical protein
MPAKACLRFCKFGVYETAASQVESIGYNNAKSKDLRDN